MPQLLFGAMLISFSAVFVKLTQVSAGASTFYRVFFGGLALGVFLVASGGWRTVSRRLIAGSMLCGLFFTFDLWCWHASIHYIGPGQATMLGNFQVFFLTGTAIVFLGQRPNATFLISLAMAMTGLYCIVGAGWSVHSADYKTGVYFGLLTAVFYTLFLLALKKTVSGQAGPVAVMTAVSFATALFMALLMVATGDSFAIPDGKNLICLLAYGVLCQGLGWFLISTGLKHTRAALAGLILLLQPILSYVWDVLIFAKPVTPLEIFGAALALTAIYLGSTAGRKA
jgi:drug/metabolite transporter (DMT)-like permease